MSCPAAITVKIGDNIRADVTWTNQSSTTITVDIVFWILRLDIGYILRGIAKGQQLGAGLQRTTSITGEYPIPAGVPTGTYYHCYVVIGEGFDPNTDRFSKIFAELLCENAVYLSA